MRNTCSRLQIYELLALILGLSWRCLCMSCSVGASLVNANADDDPNDDPDGDPDEWLTYGLIGPWLTYAVPWRKATAMT